MVVLYFVIGLLLLGIGFALSGSCQKHNTDIVSNVVFVLTWPVGLYAEVYRGGLSAEDWLRTQACEGGGELGVKRTAI